MLIQTPISENRPYQTFFSTYSRNRIYLDPTTWEIIGKYESHKRYIVPQDVVTGRFIDIYPLTIGWIGDLHITDNISEKINKVFGKFERINPSISIILGDIVNGCGTYDNMTIKEEWFKNAWNNMKQKLPNVFWIKGNHDVEPSRHYYYDWFKRIWYLRLRKINLIGFDTYNEDKVMEGTVSAHVAISDIFYLKRIFSTTDNWKIIFSHHPLNEWYSSSHNVLKDSKETTLNIAAHSHTLEKRNVNDIDTYVNGTAGPNYEGHIISILTIYPDKTIKLTNIKGKIEIEQTDNYVKIKTGEVVNWENETIKDNIPIRLNIGNINLLALVPSETETVINYDLKEKEMVISKEIETFVTGRIKIDNAYLVDTYPLLDGTEINSYHVTDRQTRIKLK